MKLDFNLQIAQKQGLTLTAQVQQAIKLLHMTNMEIQEFVSDQFQDNPFVETNSQSEEHLTTDSKTNDKKENCVQAHKLLTVFLETVHVGSIR